MISVDFSVPIFIESFSSYFHIPGSFLCNIGGHKKPPETAAFFFSLLFHTGHGSTGFSVLAASHQAGENMNDQTIIVCTSRLENWIKMNQKLHLEVGLETVLQIEAWDCWLSKLTTSLWEVRKKQDSLNCLGKKSRSARNLNELTGLLQNDVPHMPKPPWWSLTMLQHKPERKVAGNIWEPSSFCGISIRKAAAFTLIPNLSSECTPESTQRSSQLANTQFLGRWPVLDSKHTSGANRTNPKVQRSVTWFQGSYCLHCFSVKHNQLATGKIIVCQQCWPHALFWRCYLLCQLGPQPPHMFQQGRSATTKRTLSHLGTSRLLATKKDRVHIGSLPGSGCIVHLEVSINGGSPIDGWFIMEKSIKIDDLGGTPILGNPHLWIIYDLCPFTSKIKLQKNTQRLGLAHPVHAGPNLSVVRLMHDLATRNALSGRGLHKTETMHGSQSRTINMERWRKCWKCWCAPFGVIKITSKEAATHSEQKTSSLSTGVYYVI